MDKSHGRRWSMRQARLLNVLIPMRPQTFFPMARQVQLGDPVGCYENKNERLVIATQDALKQPCRHVFVVWRRCDALQHPSIAPFATVQTRKSHLRISVKASSTRELLAMKAFAILSHIVRKIPQHSAALCIPTLRNSRPNSPGEHFAKILDHTHPLKRPNAKLL